MERLLDYFDNLAPLIPLLIFGSLIRGFRKSRSRRKQNEPEAKQISGGEKKKSSSMPSWESRDKPAVFEEPWPTERPLEREQPDRVAFAKEASMREMAVKDNISRVKNAEKSNIVPLQKGEPIVPKPSKDSLTRIESLSPFARGMVWTLILGKPLSLKNPEDR